MKLADGSIVYATEVTAAKGKEESAVYRRLGHEKELVTSPSPDIATIQDMILKQVRENGTLPFLGQRELLDDGTLANKYSWETFAEVGEVATALGSGMIHLNFAHEKKQFQNLSLKFISIYAKNSREWIITDIANSLFGFTSVPIYDTLGEEATEHMFNETELSTVFLTSNHVKGLANTAIAGKLPHLRNLVVMDDAGFTPELEKELKGTELKLHRFIDVIKIGRENTKPYPKLTPDDMHFFSYTSGTTGQPKGAMVSHRNSVAQVGGLQNQIPIKTIVYLSYLPLAHVLERIVFMYILSTAGMYGMFNGDVLKLTEDLPILKPNLFISVPRLYNKFYEKIKAKIEGTTGCKGSIAKKGLAKKLANYDNTGSYQDCFYDFLVFKKMKALMGGNVKYMISGSAPISTEVMKYLKCCFCCPFVEGYGQTEGMGGTFTAIPEDPMLGHVGGPLPHAEYKLIAVPEMNYFPDDKDENGELCPRGEILVRGSAVIQGYYKAPEKTAEAIDKDGWLHSGDIGMILPKSKALKIFDRRKNIFKLSQGEYIAPDKLEQNYKTTVGVADIYVYGDSFKSTLIGIVNLNPTELSNIAKEANLSFDDMDRLCKDQKVNEIILKRLNNTVATTKMKGFERLKKIYLEPVPFADSGLHTTTFKLKRNEAKQHFAKIIDELYVGLD